MSHLGDHRVGHIACVLVAAGCGRIDFDPTGQVDARGVLGIDGATSCTFGPWTSPTIVSELSQAGVNEQGPALSPDGLTIYYQSDGMGVGKADLFAAQRATPTSMFGAPVPLPALETTSQDRDPVVAAGGTHLYFTSDRNSQANDSLFMSIGAGTSFGPPTEIMELGAGVLGPWVSDDELELFYGSLSNQLFQSTRTSTVDLWGSSSLVPELLPGGDGTAAYPTFTADSLTILFEGSLAGGPTVIYTASRASLTSMFSGVTPVAELNGSFAGTGDPALSHDGRSIFFSAQTALVSDSDIYTSTRSCQ